MLASFALLLAVQAPAGIARMPLVENASVVCTRLSYAPGAAETSHTHPFSAVVIQLTAGEVDVTIGDEHTHAYREAGFVWFVPKGVPHAAKNAGTAPFEQITIALKPDRPSATAGPATTAPQGIARTTILDNDEARVVRVEFSPGGREPVHEHSQDLITVQLTPGRLEILVGEKKETVDAPAGEVRFLPRQMRHSYASVSPVPFMLFSVTIK